MFKKIFAIATLLCALPVLANAWTLGTWAKSQGGIIDSVNNSAQTVANGSVTKSYTTTGTEAVTVDPNDGWKISKLEINGIIQVLTPAQQILTQVVNAPRTGAQRVYATFARQSFTLTATAGSNGLIIGKKEYLATYLGTQSPAKTFVFQPLKNTSVTVALAGLTLGTDYQLVDAVNGAPIVGATGAVNQVVKVNVVNVPNTVAANMTCGATFAGIVVTPPEVPASNCNNCHKAQGVGVGIADNSKHIANAVTCVTCHVGATGGAHPGSLQPGCNSCHNDVGMDNVAGSLAWNSQNCGGCHKGGLLHSASVVGSCLDCHVGPTGGAHGSAGFMATLAANQDNCVGCHDVAATQHGADLVGDNGGVRAIVPEFAKRSHHITGATPTNAQCIACHLEGQVVAGAVVINNTYHMQNNKIHLRNSDTNADMGWDGTNHTLMDNFCFSCHDSNGAAGIVASGIPTVNALATTSNPFGDTLTNSYDQVARTGVVDVKTAFTTTNASHHAVSGQRYTYRFSTLANAQAWAERNNKPLPPNSEIAEFAVGYPNATINEFDASMPYEPHGAHEGGAATLYEADKFVASYIPLGAAENVADNSTLHCGDCHTVGQWKAGSSTNANGTATTAAIGAHGSANDYLLRNSLGTDAIHSSQTYVCFNCHKGGQLMDGGAEVVAATNLLYDELYAEGFITLAAYTAPRPTWKAGWGATHPNIIAGQVSGYATAHAVSAFHAQCIADSSVQVGVTNRLALQTGGGHKDRIFDFLPAPGATAAVPSTPGDSGNITGIGCTSCHNSGIRSGWGGIHGGNNAYTDGLGRAQTTYRFMPGMGNYRYAPPGGWDGRNVSDSTLQTQATSGVGAGKPMGGCYTNGSATDTNPGFSTCSHHGTSTAQTTAGGQAAGFRTTYGGGTTATPTAVEPTVREATAGNSLVTRPLKY